MITAASSPVDLAAARRAAIAREQFVHAEPLVPVRWSHTSVFEATDKEIAYEMASLVGRLFNGLPADEVERITDRLDVLTRRAREIAAILRGRGVRPQIDRFLLSYVSIEDEMGVADNHLTGERLVFKCKSKGHAAGLDDDLYAGAAVVIHADAVEVVSRGPKYREVPRV